MSLSCAHPLMGSHKKSSDFMGNMMRNSASLLGVSLAFSKKTVIKAITCCDLLKQLETFVNYI